MLRSQMCGLLGSNKATGPHSMMPTRHIHFVPEVYDGNEPNNLPTLPCPVLNTTIYAASRTDYTVSIMNMQAYSEICVFRSSRHI